MRHWSLCVADNLVLSEATRVAVSEFEHEQLLRPLRQQLLLDLNSQ